MFTRTTDLSCEFETRQHPGNEVNRIDVKNRRAYRLAIMAGTRTEYSAHAATSAKRSECL